MAKATDVLKPPPPGQAILPPAREFRIDKQPLLVHRKTVLKVSPMFLLRGFLQPKTE